MPADSSPGMNRPSLQASRRRQPPPGPPGAGDPSGPPSIGLGDSAHNEFDLGGGGASLELDLSGGGPGAQPPPGISTGDMDFPAPVNRPPADASVDLPGPVSASGPPGHSLDLPAPSTSNLPAPSFGGRPAPPSAPLPPSRSPYGGGPPAGPPGAGLPSFSNDLPAPVELDLPTPASAGQAVESLDLPLPDNLPTPGGGMGLAPSEMGVAPSEMGMAPSELGMAPSELGMAPSELGMAPSELGMAPSELGVTPANIGVAPHPGAAAGVPAPVPGVAAPAEGSSLPPMAVPGVATPPPGGQSAVVPKRPAVSRGLLIAVGGLAILGVAGAGVLYSGILDPVDPEITTTTGTKPKGGKGAAAKGETKAEAKAPQLAVDPAAPAVERSSAVLAIMAKHTPVAYLEARAAATEAGDAVGVAECSLLLHYHYGPSPTMAAEAAAVLQAQAANTEPFVQRVIGLNALAAGDLAAAEAALVGDAPRTRLYRGWLRLAQGKLDEAKAEADAVLAALADELSAKHLTLAIAAARDPVAAMPTIQAAVGKSAHPALQALLGTTAIDTGLLAAGRTAIDAIDPSTTEDPGTQAWTHVQHARIRAAQGDFTEALAAYDSALEKVAQDPSIQIERIRTQVKAKRYQDASAAVSALVREKPQDAEILLLQAEVAIASGDGDIALQILETLAAALPEDSRVPRLKGEVHAMRLQIEEGQAAFAAARALDDADRRIAIGEAILMADAKRLPDALSILAKARAAAEASGRTLDQVRLLVTKAQLHEKAGEVTAALEALDRALGVLSTDNEAQVMRGTLRMRQGQAAEGRADLVAVFERTGGFAGLAGPLGAIFVAENDFDALDRLVGGRLRGDQTDDELLLPGVRLRLHQGRIDDARALVEIALARRPADWEAHMLKAQLFISEGKATEALAEIELSRPATPQAELMLQRGKILEYNAKHDDAIPEYRKALELDPNLHEARFLFGRLLHYKGGHGKAITELTKVVEAPGAKSAPWFPEVWLNMGMAQQAQGKHADSIDSLRKATAIDPKLGQAWAKIGEFQENLNKHGEAITALNKAIKLGTKDDFWFPDALMNLGRAQAKSGKKSAAKKTLKKYLEVAPAESTSRAEAERLLGSL